MKKIFYALFMIYVLSIFGIILFFPSKELITRFIVISSYLFIVILCYYIYKYKSIGLVSKLSYYSDFNSNEKSNQYLKYVYKSAITFFFSGLLLTCIFHVLRVSIFADIIIFLALLFIWAILCYKFSKKINLNR